MISTRLQIANGEVYDTYAEYGLCYLSSDHIVDAPIKGFEKTTYAEEEGEHIDPKTVADAFDYKVRFLVMAKNSNIENANIIISNFNRRLYEQSEGSNVRTYHQIAFYNDYKRVKIVGYPQPLSEAKEFYRDKNGKVADAVQVELTIRVTKPSLCDFELSTTPNQYDSFFSLESLGGYLKLEE